jgi:hypothetical protein
LCCDWCNKEVTQLKLIAVIRKIKGLKRLKLLKNKTGYVVANFLSALFCSDRDGLTASDRGLAVLGSFSIFLIVFDIHCSCCLNKVYPHADMVVSILSY